MYFSHLWHRDVKSVYICICTYIHIHMYMYILEVEEKWFLGTKRTKGGGGVRKEEGGDMGVNRLNTQYTLVQKINKYFKVVLIFM